MMPEAIFYVLLGYTCLPLCPNLCDTTLPILKREEAKFLCSDRHAPFCEMECHLHSRRIFSLFCQIQF